MTEHIQSAPPKPRPKRADLEMLENALAAAISFRQIIPANNALALKRQDQIINDYRRRITDLTRGDQWLT